MAKSTIAPVLTYQGHRFFFEIGNEVLPIFARDFVTAKRDLRRTVTGTDLEYSLPEATLLGVIYSD